MSFGEDEEILQDFLVEAGEILDQLTQYQVQNFSHRLAQEHAQAEITNQTNAQKTTATQGHFIANRGH